MEIFIQVLMVGENVRITITKRQTETNRLQTSLLNITTLFETICTDVFCDNHNLLV